MSIFASIGAAANGFWLPLIAVTAVGAIVIASKVQQQQSRRQKALALADLHALNPRGLELHVAQVISALPGWTATANRGSADQGADVIATGPKGRKVAVQVKHYPNSNVGNKAVQEIVASKAIYRCAHAVVVTSGPGYTRAAQDLARANRVVLWHPDDLLWLQELAKAGQTPPQTLLPI
ncbi:restriction endonuclease [Deinococcus radiopugnans]|uniref:HJR/Mrr/RecB family endonuclease n=1 Tax=Deinococcus radiopugnans ATCC 19172 TaxID=585398 RepID=A0ABR6NS10_9DEIO|nr:restriction endonuclease [Deinococcus radiopugnans]MBB6016832.1 HJR/Mrr/RecB family endonuclease [Deinococcus radiopugnans ATCC 19172]